MDKNDITRKLTVKDFFRRFPDENHCLEHIMDVRFGLRHTCQACGVVDATFHRLENRKAYCCAHCGDHLYPCAGTIFEKSRTPLQLWFYAIFLFTTTRHGVSGMELHRALGVTRKTGYRMGMQIRKLMSKADFQGMLGGIGRQIEIDEAYIGGRSTGGKRGRGASGKTVVIAIKERGGYIRAQAIENASTKSLREVFDRNVARETVVSTDEWAGYNLVTPAGHWHGTVKHGEKEYANTDEMGFRHHVNGVENFWKLFKASIRSTHIQISKEYADRYLGEFTFRANHVEMQNAMFDVLIAAV